MSCKCFYRLLVCVFVTALAICTIVPIATPLLTRTVAAPNGGTTVLTIKFMNIDNTTNSTAGVVTKTRINTRDVPCAQTKSYFLAAFAMVVIAAILGCVNVFLALVWLMSPCRCPIGILVFLLTFVCFAGTFSSFILISVTMGRTKCNDVLSQALSSTADNSLGAGAGMALLLVAFVGLFLTLVMQIVGCACGCQLERSKSVKAHDTTVEGFDRTSNFSTRTGSNYQSTEMKYRPMSK